MRIILAAAALMMTGARTYAQPPAQTPLAGSQAESAAPPQTAPEKTKFDAYADQELARLNSFIDAAKAELDALEKEETGRLETVAKRAGSEPFAEEDKAKLKSLRELMTGSSEETRERALRDLQDELRTEKMKSIWTDYKTKKKALWEKFTRDWKKVLTQPPLMIRKKR